jgi:hypothetical protein
MSTTPIKLAPRQGATNPAYLEALTASEVFACDFAVKGAETWTETPGGFRNGRILNIDHHAPVARMYCPISSTNLAVAHVHALGIARPDDLVVIDHTDCDSILSAGIGSGRLDPLDSLASAAIAADHTGAENRVADLLQAIEYRRDSNCRSGRSNIGSPEGRWFPNCGQTWRSASGSASRRVRWSKVTTSSGTRILALHGSATNVTSTRRSFWEPCRQQH